MEWKGVQSPPLLGDKQKDFKCVNNHFSHSNVIYFFVSMILLLLMLTTPAVLANPKNAVNSLQVPILEHWLFIRFHGESDESMTGCSCMNSSSHKRKLTRLEGIREGECQSNSLFLHSLLSFLTSKSLSSINDESRSSTNSTPTFYTFWTNQSMNETLLLENDSVDNAFGYVLLYQSSINNIGCDQNNQPEAVIPIYFTLNTSNVGLTLETCAFNDRNGRMISLSQSSLSLVTELPQDIEFVSSGLWSPVSGGIYIEQ